MLALKYELMWPETKEMLAATKRGEEPKNFSNSPLESLEAEC